MVPWVVSEPSNLSLADSRGDVEPKAAVHKNPKSVIIIFRYNNLHEEPEWEPPDISPYLVYI